MSYTERRARREKRANSTHMNSSSTAYNSSSRGQTRSESVGTIDIQRAFDAASRKAVLSCPKRVDPSGTGMVRRAYRSGPEAKTGTIASRRVVRIVFLKSL
ncbi:hypothetical protein PUNSTDRAFT_49546 [Punctularia strigosozonata HHB-11173 SS5]|uniref:uncharacterized protein n=1 Tax=Punctularia strigosozonata (strain HHB-11173) TaxID=741275 RepID=UPI0004416626|nr:uncharacterized protein PUNSTDRAFT_49546 [Punctularia strigosozonata HHB-11173 SS5]EIN12270.1 hypothetical protein PUNSTDRAFT_49546 [Punctularia strigosozonata HHB-11173 SS5]